MKNRYYTLIISNKITNNCFIINLIDNNFDTNTIYYNFDVSLLNGLADGEYNYIIVSDWMGQGSVCSVDFIDNVVISDGISKTIMDNGLMIIGNYVNEVIFYEKKGDGYEYIQYNEKN